MKDKNENTIAIGDRIKILWAVNNREYEGDVIGFNGNIALVSVKNYMVYVKNPDRMVKVDDHINRDLN